MYYMKNDLDYKDQLTNEELLKRFKNQFELVRYAIQLAENTVRSGREPEMGLESQNVAYQILAEIASHTEQFAEIPEAEEAPAPVQVRAKEKEMSWNEEVKALKEDKKVRKTKKAVA